MDDVDEWFYDSIKRYNKLQMYTLNENVNQFEFSQNKSNICVSNVNTTTGRCQILEYELPSKFLDTTDTLCSSDHNLKIACGTYVDHLVLELKIVASTNQILTSEKKQSSINVYTFPGDNSDKITKTDIIPCEYEEPHISSHPLCDHLLALSHFCDEPVIVMDMNRKIPVQKFNVDSSLLKNISILPSPLKTAFVDTNTLCVCLGITGQVLLYDLRCSEKVVDSYAKDEPKRQGAWTLSVSHTSTPSINLISTKADVTMVDPRSLSKPTFHARLPIRTQDLSVPQLEPCPYEPQQFSVSGFNESVQIFARREETMCDEVFTHDAHPYQENCEKNVRVLSHKWMPGPYERMLLSSASNATFSCVQFNSKSLE